MQIPLQIIFLKDVLFRHGFIFRNFFTGKMKKMMFCNKLRCINFNDKNRVFFS